MRVCTCHGEGERRVDKGELEDETRAGGMGGGISPRFWLAERIRVRMRRQTIVFAAWGFLYLDDEEFI